MDKKQNKNKNLHWLNNRIKTLARVCSQDATAQTPSQTPMSKRITMLELELDDLLDPSLPRMYDLPQKRARFQPPEIPPNEFSIGDDFTPENEEFRKTPLRPPFTPVLTDSGVELLIDN